MITVTMTLKAWLTLFISLRCSLRGIPCGSDSGLGNYDSYCPIIISKFTPVHPPRAYPVFTLCNSQHHWLVITTTTTTAFYIKLWFSPLKLHINYIRWQRTLFMIIMFYNSPFVLICVLRLICLNIFLCWTVLVNFFLDLPHLAICWG